MSPDLERLIQLQRLENAIADARREVAEGPDRRAEAEASLASAQQAVDSATERLKASQDARRALEKEASVFEGRLSKYRDQLSAVKTNREYQAMQTEIASAESDLRAVEDRELEYMVEADALAADIKTSEAALGARQKDVAAKKRALDEALTRTEASLLKLTAERDALVGQIDGPLLALFEQVAQLRKGVAVCPTHDGLCSLCHVRLRPQVFQEVRRNDSVIQCDVCQRILYFDPPSPAEGQETPAANA